MNTQGSLDSMNRVKVLVVGEAGVGKTTLVQAIRGQAVKSPPWTVGCSVELIIHPFRAGTQQERPFFVELWDVGGSRSHRNARRVFYPGTSGLILLHDLGNRKSEESLESWVSEVKGFGGLDAVVSSTPQGRIPTVDEKSSLPTLVVGSKADLYPDASPSKELRRLQSSVGAEEQVTMDCREPITPGSTNGLKIARFFDRVILDYCRKTPGMSSVAVDTTPGNSLFDRSSRRLY